MKITVAKMTDLISQVTLGKISFSRMVEILNDETKTKQSYTASKMIEGVHEVIVVWPGINQKSKGRVVNNGSETIVYLNDAFPSPQPDLRSEYKQLVNDLADWSRKYPRGLLYGEWNKEMRDERLSIEERAMTLSQLPQDQPEARNEPPQPLNEVTAEEVLKKYFSAKYLNDKSDDGGEWMVEGIVEAMHEYRNLKFNK